MEPSGDRPLPPPPPAMPPRRQATSSPPAGSRSSSPAPVEIPPVPPPPPTEPAQADRIPSPSTPTAVPGQLTGTWRLLLSLAWIAAFFAYAAIWQASVQLGIGTWWIGPRAQPAPTMLRLLPFVVCLVMTVLVVYGFRRLPQIGMALALGLVAFSVPDFGRSMSLAVTELIVGLTLLAASAAARTGQYRPPDTVPGSPTTDR